MRRVESPLEVVVKGAFAGLFGAFALNMAAQQMQKMMGQPPAPAEAEPPPQKDAKEELVAKVAGSVFETELPEHQRKSLAEALHWIYGAWWGAIYGLSQGSFHFPGWFFGPLYGFAVWLAGPVVLLPAMKLSPRQADLPPAAMGSSIVIHLAYGAGTALVFGLLSLTRGPKKTCCR
jgi:uncharacterized membrane protein YagU involved in acid resistance